MPFRNEHASGDSLIRLENSASLKAFNATILQQLNHRDPIEPLPVERRSWVPKRVIAIDGSNLSVKVKNGFPGAEAGLVQISVVSIDLAQLAAVPQNEIPRPKVFHDMERAVTVDAVLPGANVVRVGDNADSPRRFFRQCVQGALNSTISASHESLLDTYRAITATRSNAEIRCPGEGCEERVSPGSGQHSCTACSENLLETDALRLHERFNDIGSNGEVHGEVRHILEVLVLLNILRFFATDERAHFLRDCAFVLDGPLAIFGQPAWLTPYVRAEVRRVNGVARRINGADLVLIGIEKTGQFVAHFDELDWCEQRGPRGRFPNSSAITISDGYIKRNIILSPEDSKPHGQATYFGRKVLYKTLAGEHAVANVAMLNDAGADFTRSDIECYPRLGDVLDVLDRVATYLYQDGFMPLVRAHAHAAIPLIRGSDIIASLFDGRAAP